MIHEIRYSSDDGILYECVMHGGTFVNALFVIVIGWLACNTYMYFISSDVMYVVWSVMIFICDATCDVLRHIHRSECNRSDHMTNHEYH